MSKAVTRHVATTRYPSVLTSFTCGQDTAADEAMTALTFDGRERNLNCLFQLRIASVFPISR